MFSHPLWNGLIRSFTLTSTSILSRLLLLVSSRLWSSNLLREESVTLLSDRNESPMSVADENAFKKTILFWPLLLNVTESIPMSTLVTFVSKYSAIASVGVVDGFAEGCDDGCPVG